MIILIVAKQIQNHGTLRTILRCEGQVPRGDMQGKIAYCAPDSSICGCSVYTLRIWQSHCKIMAFVRSTTSCLHIQGAWKNIIFCLGLEREECLAKSGPDACWEGLGRLQQGREWSINQLSWLHQTTLQVPAGHSHPTGRYLQEPSCSMKEQT